MNSYHLQRYVKLGLIYLALVFFGFIALGPVAWIWVSSLKTNNEIRTSALGWPSQVQWQNYVDAWVGAHFGTYFLNSVIVGISTGLIVLTLGSLAAYAFARMSFAGNRAIFFIIFVGMTFPISARIGPLLTFMYALRLVDTRLALILAYAAGALPFSILMMRSFFRGFPRELEDAARIDGCSSLQFFAWVLIPLSTPALFTLGVFVFMDTWNEFFIALLLISRDAVRTLPLGLMSFQDEFYTNYALSFAGIVITAMPVVLVYMLFQRSFISGITAGSIK